ncbi:glycoside hydrolase family 2 TIM barrel-domain containing protein [Persicobacter diffluens]|uniref:Beta-galactosidase n=1 Tax=Persicobacter diffluens TaxID=981 RepID=A0AAN4W4A9_9BACT|nr:beta-galactosidase [Persicobacter diffluens]
MSKKKHLLVLLILLIGQLISNPVSADSVSTYKQNFNAGWFFYISDTINIHNVSALSGEWVSVHLPHDANLIDKEDQSLLGQQNPLPAQLKAPYQENFGDAGDVGYFPPGTVWYKKAFQWEQKDKAVFLNFDGIHSQSEIYINGQKVAENTGGYTPVNIDLSQYLVQGENTLYVKASNQESASRWYAGLGIYRDVHLYVLPRNYVNPFNFFVRTSEVTTDQAKVQVDFEIAGKKQKSKKLKARIQLWSPDQKVVAEQTIKVNQPGKHQLDLTVDQPQLWDIEHPFLYTLSIELIDKEGKVHQYNTRTGIRSIEFSADQGFLLNGKSVLLKGGCIHHDNGLLGAAAHKEAEYRKIALHKNFGFNAIRTSHNPPSTHLLNACDELGVLVIDEAFDAWNHPKRKNDYHQFFADNWEKDIEAMLLRDRNHPSIIMWSYGNEIPERSRPSGIQTAQQLYDKIHALDSSRFITQGVCSFWDNPDLNWEEHTPATFEHTDVAGYNYEPDRYESDHEKYPQRIIYGSESFPNQSFDYWKKVEQLPYVVGDFVWTSMDYIGESGIGISKYVKDSIEIGHPRPWPWYNAFCGDIDLIGDLKPQGRYRQVLWQESPIEVMVHQLVPEGQFEQISRWGWPKELPLWSGVEGDTVTVNVYAQAAAVGLYLNGERIAFKDIDGNSSQTATFQLPYQKGKLEAVAYQNEVEIARKALSSPDEKATLKFDAEFKTLNSTRKEVGYIQLSLRDAHGTLHFSDRPLKITKAQGVKVLAVGNASPFIDGSFLDGDFRLFQGRAQIIVQANAPASKGFIIVTDGETAYRCDIAVE